MIMNCEEDALFLYIEMDWRTYTAKRIDTSAAALARACGVKPSTVRTSISRYERGLVKKSRYLRIWVDKEQLLENCNEYLKQDRRIDEILQII